MGTFIEDLVGTVTSVVPVWSAVSNLLRGEDVYSGPRGYTQYAASKELALRGPNLPSGYARTPSEISRRSSALEVFGEQVFGGRPWGSDSDMERLEQLGFRFRRSRRMNVLNPKALSRSIRRVKGFTHFAQRVGHYTQPGKKYTLKHIVTHRRKKR